MHENAALAVGRPEPRLDEGGRRACHQRPGRECAGRVAIAEPLFRP